MKLRTTGQTIFKINPEKQISPAPVPEHNLSIFQRIGQFLGLGKEQSETNEVKPEHQYSGSWQNEEKPEYQPEIKYDKENARILDQQEFIKLREEFKQKSQIAEAIHEPENEAEPDQGCKWER